MNGIASCDIRRLQYKIIKDNKEWQIKTDMVWWNGETKLFCVLWVSQTFFKGNNRKLKFYERVTIENKNEIIPNNREWKKLWNYPKICFKT